MTQTSYTKKVEVMSTMTAAAHPLLGKAIYGDFVEAWTLLFYHVYPKMTKGHIMKRWEELGISDLDLAQALSNNSSLSAATRERYFQCRPLLQAEMARFGRCSHHFLSSLGLPVVDRDIDRLSDKSQLCMILTSDGQLEVMRDRLVQAAEAVERRAVKAKVAEEKKAMLTRTRKTAKPAGEAKSKKRKSLHAQTHKAAFRKACKKAKVVPGDDVCITCDATWSMFLEHAEDYAGEMRQCCVCSGWQCVICAPSDEAFVKGHEFMCKASSVSRMMQAHDIQQHALLQQQRHQEDAEEEDDEEPSGDVEMEDAEEVDEEE